MGNVHDKLVSTLEDKLGLYYPSSNIETLVEYSCGELDILIIKGKEAAVFEIKSSDSYRNRRKAYTQLEKASKKYWRLKKKEFYGYYCYWTDKTHTDYNIERLI